MPFICEFILESSLLVFLLFSFVVLNAHHSFRNVISRNLIHVANELLSLVVCPVSCYGPSNSLGHVR